MNSQHLLEMFRTLVKEIEKNEEVIDRKEEAEFQKARRIVGKNILFGNEGLYNDYRENIAMTLYDAQNRDNGNDLLDFSEPEVRNRIADEILKSIFRKGVSISIPYR